MCGISPFPMPIPGHWIGRALFSPRLKNSGGQSRFSDFCVVEGRGRGGVALNPWATAATAAVKILSSVSQSGSLSHSPSSSTSALRQIYVLYNLESMASTAFYLPLKLTFVFTFRHYEPCDYYPILCWYMGPHFGLRFPSSCRGLRAPGFKQAARIPRIHKTVDIALSTPRRPRRRRRRRETEREGGPDYNAGSDAASAVAAVASLGSNLPSFSLLSSSVLTPKLYPWHEGGRGSD